MPGFGTPRRYSHHLYARDNPLSYNGPGGRWAHFPVGALGGGLIACGGQVVAGSRAMLVHQGLHGRGRADGGG